MNEFIANLGDLMSIAAFAAFTLAAVRAWIHALPEGSRFRDEAAAVFWTVASVMMLLHIVSSAVRGSW